MIPTEFEYAVPQSLDEAIDMLSQQGEDAKLLAGGHSLLPLMKLRLAAPATLVDLRRVPGLRGIERENGNVRIGAMTPHADLEDAKDLGLVSEAAGSIADRQVRHRGTIGGSLVHGDPASDLPAVMLATEAMLTAQGPAGQRQIRAADLFQDYLTTSVRPDEVVTEIRVPTLDGYSYGYEKFNRRAEDWAMVGVAALLSVRDGVCQDVRIGLTHMASTPLRATQAEQALRGQPLESQRIAEAAELAAEGTEPTGDLNATPDYKRHLARVLTRRALERAAAGRAS